MMGKMQNSGRNIIGLHIGKSNVRRHFPENLRSVELELDHLRIQCELKPSFWRDEPVITDPRLCAWLVQKNAYHESGLAPSEAVMVRASESSFRLQVARSTLHLAKLPASAP